MKKTKTAPFKLPLKIALDDRNNFQSEDSKKYPGASLMSDGWHVAHVWEDSDEIDGLKAAVFIVQAVNAYHADRELIREMREVLEHIESALVNRLLAQGPLSKEYAHNVMRTIRAILDKVRERGEKA
jgi:hypothetical protein